MKEEKTKAKKTEVNEWILPGNSLDYNEFIQGIQKAEEGPFHSVQESMEHFEKWLKSRGRK